MTEGPNTPPMGEPPDPGQSAPSGGAPPPPPQGQPAPGGAAASGVGAPADLGTRVIARVIDFILLWIVNMVVVFTVLMGAIFGGGGNMFGGGFGLRGIIGSVISAAIYVGYFAFLESSRGQTLGKMLMKVKVEGPDGQLPTMEQAIKRNAWLAIAIIPLIGWLLQLAAAIYIIVTINNNTQTRQGWHDEFADGTRVVKTA
jgi:uncharacterized RDD family membrane protein YckC